MVSWCPGVLVFSRCGVLLCSTVLVSTSEMLKTSGILNTKNHLDLSRMLILSSVLETFEMFGRSISGTKRAYFASQGEAMRQGLQGGQPSLTPNTG